ncbi:hypothetical protein TI39_contig428g00012 [Zymoseptoria brevis]|uniref:Uncharacterized protein n=1 Tax=Zymoseptoria brevis TaxID=1047168 RepID=A0A0F4GLT3_9PEZI|nr:hypothetical protein TI39_contig428g00012 [Zymoseptoria brevis]
MPSFVERLTGKRHQHPAPTANSTANSSTPNLLDSYGSSNASPANSVAGDAGSAAGDTRSRDRTLNRKASGHKRDSSILSLSSVTDQVASVRRSVSLRSHRRNNSSGGNNSTGSGGSFRQVGSPLRGGSKTDKEGDGSPSQFSDSQYTQQAPPPLRHKVSLTSRGLNRFRSTESISNNRNTAIYLDGVGGTPGSSTTMLAPSINAPTLGGHPRQQPSDALRPQTSFTREARPFLPPTASSSGPTPTPNSLVYTQIQETSARRIATITYLQRLHTGDIFHFSTYHYSSGTLSQLASLQPHKLGRRATNYFILGYSLPALLDLNSASPLEYLKALSSLLHEFETYQNLSGFDASGNTLSKTRMGAMFKSSMGLGGHRNKTARRASTVSASLGAPPTPSVEGMEARQAELLGIPRQTSFSSTATGPNAAEATSPSAMDLTSLINPTNHEFAFLLTPHLPYEPDFATTFSTLCDTLIDTYAKLLELITGPEACNGQVGAEFVKADKAIRKVLVVNAVRELEEGTRTGLKAEVGGLGKLVLGGLM